MEIAEKQDTANQDLIQDRLSQIDDGAARKECSRTLFSNSVASLSTEDVITKQCRGCKEVKSLSEFHRQKRGRLGYTARCKTCVRQSIETRTCQDCGKPIGSRAIRCRSCASKARWASGIFDNDDFRRKWSEGISKGVKAAWARGAYDNRVTEELRHKLSALSKARWASGVMDNIWTEGLRQRRSEAMKAAWARGVYEHRGTPEYRAKMSEVKKAAWARGDYDNRKPWGSQRETVK